MKYAICNPQGIVYSIRDTTDGFDPARTRGELCVPITEEQAAVVRPHYALQMDGSLRPRELATSDKERALAALDSELEAEREAARDRAGKALVSALLSEDRAAETTVRSELQAELALVDAKRAPAAAQIDAATHYYELPARLRYDGGANTLTAEPVGADEAAAETLLRTADGDVRPLAHLTKQR